jgi:hypothetical protein
MILAEKIIDKLVEKITKGVIDDIKKSINKIIEQGISNNLSKVMLEGELYKTIKTRSFKRGLPIFIKI